MILTTDSGSPASALPYSEEGRKEGWYARDSVSPQSRLELPFVTCRFRAAPRSLSLSLLASAAAFANGEIGFSAEENDKKFDGGGD